MYERRAVPLLTLSTPHLFVVAWPQVIRPLLLIAAFCVLGRVGAAALPSPSPSPAPQKRPVECGKPGHCPEAAGLKDQNEGHEVRCCSDVQPVQNSTEGDPYPWTRNAGCSVWGGSDEGSNWQCSKNKTFAEAEAICRVASARLCATEELVAGCAAGTGCGFDTQLVWAVPPPPPPPPPSPSPPPQKRPVECGSLPGHCPEAAGLKDPNEGHEVRCCSDVQPVQNSTEGDPYPWTRNAGCSVWGGSDEGSNWQCSKNKTFAEAEAICRVASARLCATEELVAGCAAGTGCGFNTQLVWAVPPPPPPTPPPLSLSLERPVVTLVEPNQKAYYPLHFPEGSPWCGSGKPTYWWTGHHSGDPFYCEESDGVWVQGQPYMSGQDRHGCGVVDVDQDGFDDVVCAIGTHPPWPS